MTFMQALVSQKIAVLGAGITGTAVLDFLVTRGVNADLFDEKAPLAKRSVDEIYDLAIVSPGWRLDNPIVIALRNGGCEILSEIDFAWKVKEEIAPNQKWIGPTGTNGKTSTATMLSRLFRQLGYHVGLISTVQNQIDETVIPSTHTTPDAVQINALLAQMVETGCAYCFMEVSSHAVDQKRIAGLQFKGALFTNITHDHLDYHKTFRNYLDAKKKFFDDMGPDAFTLTNADDKNGMVMLQNTRAKKYSYALKTPADFKGKILENTFLGLLLQVDGLELQVGPMCALGHLGLAAQHLLGQIRHFFGALGLELRPSRDFEGFASDLLDELAPLEVFAFVL
jgi:UDP-N-acetylmuramoylalanine-D-glutamate ligase